MILVHRKSWYQFMQDKLNIKNFLICLTESIFGGNFKTRVFADMSFLQKVKEPLIFLFQTISRRVWEPDFRQLLTFSGLDSEKSVLWTDRRTDRLSRIHRTLPIKRISKIDWTIIIQHPLPGSRKSVVPNSNYFRSVSWEAAVWDCSIEWLFWISRENSEEHVRGGANFSVKVQAKGWKLATKLKIGLTDNFLKRFWTAFFQNTSKRPLRLAQRHLFTGFPKIVQKIQKNSQENFRSWLQSYLICRLDLQLY